MEATEPKPKLPPPNCRLLPQRSGGYLHVLVLPLSFRSHRSIHGANRATKTEELAIVIDNERREMDAEKRRF
jgi:hypothetical protein